MPGLVHSLTRAVASALMLSTSAVLFAGCGANSQDLAGPQTEANAAEPGALASADVRQRTEVYEFGDFALYVPAKANQVRGILLALGGPNTRGFAAGTPFGAPLPEVEESLQTLGEMLRDLAADRGLAILGSSRFGPTALTDEPASDQLLLDAVAQAAAISGRSDLLDAPFLLYGLSGGAPEASGFASRNPGRVAGLFLKVPAGVAPPASAEALRVPTFMILAELDAFIDNSAMSAAFLARRAAGAPWALAMEPGVLHHSATPAHRELTVNWMRRILTFSVDPASAGSLHRRPAHVGWLGDPSTGNVAPFANFDGDRSTASWFPTRAIAEEWAALIGF